MIEKGGGPAVEEALATDIIIVVMWLNREHGSPTVVLLIAFACRALPTSANTTPTMYVLRVVRLTWVQLSRTSPTKGFKVAHRRLSAYAYILFCCHCSSGILEPFLSVSEVGLTGMQKRFVPMGGGMKQQQLAWLRQACISKPRCFRATMFG